MYPVDTDHRLFVIKLYIERVPQRLADICLDDDYQREGAVYQRAGSGDHRLGQPLYRGKRLIAVARERDRDLLLPPLRHKERQLELYRALHPFGSSLILIRHAQDRDILYRQYPRRVGDRAAADLRGAGPRADHRRPDRLRRRIELHLREGGLLSDLVP